jgi:hypothetical protein
MRPTMTRERGSGEEYRVERFRAREGSGNRSDQPLSPLETLLHAHPDIQVERDYIGEIKIWQYIVDMERFIRVEVEREEGSSRLYPTVVLHGINTARHNSLLYDDIEQDQRGYATETHMRVYTEDDESVHVEVEYEKGKDLPPNMNKRRQRLIKYTTEPMLASELLATAKTGLEILTAYCSASDREQTHVYNSYQDDGNEPQVSDWLHPDLDERIALASPVVSNAMKRHGMSFEHEGIKPFFVLNALNKVTEGMLPKTKFRRRNRMPGFNNQPPGR